MPHLRLTGSLDVSTGDGFAEYVIALGPEHQGWMLMDASGLNMITSSGAGSLIRLASRSAERGGGVALVVPRGDVRQAIQFMRLDLVIDTFDTLEAAASFIDSAPKLA